MEIMSVIIPGRCAMDKEIVEIVKEKYNLKLIDYPWGNGTIVEELNNESHSGTSVEIIESNLSFDEMLRWCKGVFAGNDIFKNSNKYIVVNGGGYHSIPGRGYLDMSDAAKNEKIATSEIIDEIVTTNSPVIEGFMIPFLGISYPEIHRITGCKNVNVVSGKEFISFGNGCAIEVVYTSLTRYQLLNWINHIVYEGKNIYPQAEIVIENYLNNSKLKEILKDCISLYEFKKNLLTK